MPIGLMYVPLGEMTLTGSITPWFRGSGVSAIILARQRRGLQSYSQLIMHRRAYMMAACVKEGGILNCTSAPHRIGMIV